jgi:hypothetical protein
MESATWDARRQTVEGVIFLRKMGANSSGSGERSRGLRQERSIRHVG